MNVQSMLNAFEAEKKIEIIKTPFVVKRKPKIDISFDSKNHKPQNTPTHVTYHRDLEIGSILVYWHTLMLYFVKMAEESSKNPQNRS